MKIYTQYSDFKKIKPVVLTIGTFDGVHLGHRKILSKITEICKKHDAESVVMTFEPHPRRFLFPDQNDLKLLSGIEEKTELLKDCGINHLIIQPFNATFASLNSEQYVNGILEKSLKTDILVIGYDHRFGKNREGNIDLLRKMNPSFEIIEITAFEIDQINISSTVVRRALLEGNIETANNYLGYTFFMKAKVIEGKKLGRQIGFPTANLELLCSDKIIPQSGVYAVWVTVENQLFKGMMNIGINPSVSNNTALKLEVHCIDFNKNIYNEQVKISFVKKMREERKFANLDELKKQLANDKIEANAILKT